MYLSLNTVVAMLTNINVFCNTKSQHTLIKFEITSVCLRGFSHDLYLFLILIQLFKIEIFSFFFHFSFQKKCCILIEATKKSLNNMEFATSKLFQSDLYEKIKKSKTKQIFCLFVSHRSDKKCCSQIISITYFNNIYFIW